MLLASNRMHKLGCKPTSTLDWNRMQQFLLNQPSRHRGMRFLSSSTLSTTNSERLFPEELNIIYDSKCNVCKLEIDFLAKRDAQRVNIGAPKLKLTDLEALDENGNHIYDPSDPANGGVSYEDGMKAIHAVTATGKVFHGVPVFALAYEQVKLGWLFKITTWPILKDLVEIAYTIFAKYRTHITRGASVQTLVQQYEQKKTLENQIKNDDCSICNQKVKEP